MRIIGGCFCERGTVLDYQLCCINTFVYIYKEASDKPLISELLMFSECTCLRRFYILIHYFWQNAHPCTNDRFIHFGNLPETSLLSLASFSQSWRMWYLYSMYEAFHIDGCHVMPPPPKKNPPNKWMKKKKHPKMNVEKQGVWVPLMVFQSFCIFTWISFQSVFPWKLFGNIPFIFKWPPKFWNAGKLGKCSPLP